MAWISRLDTPKDVVFSGEAAYDTSGRMCAQNFDSDVCFMWCGRITVSKKDRSMASKESYISYTYTQSQTLEALAHPS
jgi:hypothetical protein